MTPLVRELACGCVEEVYDFEDAWIGYRLRLCPWARRAQSLLETANRLGDVQSINRIRKVMDDHSCKGGR